MMNNWTKKIIVSLFGTASKSHGKRTLSSGLVIVTVLWVVILLGVIAAASGRSSRLDSKVSLAGVHGLKLR